ncbi:MAG: repeat containing protein [Rhodospirillales bacterium]|nr:repeat containing protein [Rhodospirillales bacterium]
MVLSGSTPPWRLPLPLITFLRFFASVAAAIVLACQPQPSFAAATEALTLEARIPLGDVAGRIDHLAVDVARRRLLVAELGNDSVAIVDLAAGKLLHRIAGVKEPQGIGYVAAADAIYVADGGDGVVHRYRGSDFAPLGTLALSNDADNVRVDERNGQVFVGYGSGALAVLDAASGAKTGDISLAGHPESFQLEPNGTRIFVNLPDARQIAVVDRTVAKQVATWRVPNAAANFPMALDAAGRRLAVVYRQPAELALLDSRTGNIVARLPSCGDADDIAFDAKRQRAYISCGEGSVEVVQGDGDTYREIARVPTAPGARTSLYVADLDRLFVAARATAREPATIRVFRPPEP